MPQPTIILNTLLAALFLLAPLYFQQNRGGTGLELTYNIPAWAIASYVIGWAALIITSRQQFIRPINTWALIAFPIILIISGFVAGSSQPIPWFFRQIYIIGGLLFLLGLFQFRAKPFQIDRILYLITASSLLNALVALTQILSPELIQGWLPTRDQSAIGAFQQVNVVASFLSTGLLISIYLISRPSIQSTSILFKLLLLTNIGLSSFIIVSNGSRVGLISGSIGILVLAFSRWRQLKRQLTLSFLAVALIIIGAIQANYGLARIVTTTHEITQHTESSARINMYRISLELISKEPIHGHGIGNFLRAWGQQMGDYHQRHPEAALPTYATHPHNELMYWMIEGGILALLGILVAIGAIVFALIRCGPQRGWAYTALLLPISLHTLVEMPFYISSIHWFLWLLLIFLVLRHQAVTTTLSISLAGKRLSQAATLAFCIGISYFMVHCARSQADIIDFYTQEPTNRPYLQTALNNLYFRPAAEQIAMRLFLHSNIQAQNPANVRRFTTWAEAKFARNPEMNLLQDLINAYDFLKQEDDRCRIIRTGAWIYPQEPTLQQIAQACE